MRARDAHLLRMWESADKPGSVGGSISCAAVTVIPLDARLPVRSSHLPASSVGHVNACLFGVAPGGGCRVSPRCFAHRRTGARRNGLVSVALFLASRRTVVSRHPTLWSPDFPLLERKRPHSDCLANSRANFNMRGFAFCRR